MAIAVQADSLSSITTLAANPPKYPRNPTEEVRKPLVLYIARVPGSKDVFLTTIKPRQKVVTAEDVSSSLYYLHVDQPEDISLNEKIAEQRQLENSSDLGNEERKEVSRKPLPLSPSMAERVPELPRRPNPESQGFLQSGGNQRLGDDAPIAKNLKATKRKPVGTEENVRDTCNPPEIRRRPLGPRPENSWPQSIRARLPGLENRRIQADSVDNPEGYVPPLPPRTGILNTRPPPFDERSSKPPLPQTRNLDSADSTKRSPYVPASAAASSTSDSNTARRARSESISSLSDARGFSITLIRRDPASGAQWNVGKILKAPVTGSAEECETRTSASRYTIQIEITNPGYSKFLSSNKAIVSPATQYEGNGTSSNANIESGSEEVVFRRQVSGEVTNSWLRNTWKRRSGSSDMKVSSTADAREKDNTEVDVSRLSPTSSPRKSLNNGNLESAKLRDKGYTFLSPWDGTCEFFTGASGRSLKCKHTIISTTSSGAAQTANVSELRFSLPPISFGNAFANAGTVTGNGDHDHGSTTATHNFRKRLSSQISPILNLVNDTDRLDLSLGQEKAGGGNRGKKAKLGKLIIEDEGLKMLDLIVAANMGIWWRAYDKMGGTSE